MLRGQLARFDSCLVFQDSVLTYRPADSSDGDMSGKGAVCGYQ